MPVKGVIFITLSVKLPAGRYVDHRSTAGCPGINLLRGCRPWRHTYQSVYPS